MSEAISLYGGLDLHGDNVYCTLMDNTRRIVFERRFPNDIATIREALEPFRKRIKCLAVESTYNWYWLVDGLQALKYPVALANPAKMQENIGLKYADDRSDARFIARQVVNGILPQGYIYPAETRAVRDVLRRRMRLVHARTGEWLSLEGLVARHTGREMTISDLRRCQFEELFQDQPHVLLMAEISLRHIEALEENIKELEDAVKEAVSDNVDYRRLMTVPGIGIVLARTILLETGPISRFRHAGNYASYSRAVKSIHTSNGKKKGEGNGKSGNKYLAWAFVEAANLSVRYSPELRAWFQRKQARSGKRVIAVKALANKLSKACYYMLRDGKDFDVKRLIGGE